MASVDFGPPLQKDHSEVDKLFTGNFQVTLIIESFLFENDKGIIVWWTCVFKVKIDSTTNILHNCRYS